MRFIKLMTFFPWKGRFYAMVKLRQPRYPRFHVLSVFLVLIMILFLPLPSIVQASGREQQSGGIQVEGAIIELTVKPGTVYVHKMNIGINNQSPSVDITVAASGFGITLEGEFKAIPADQDTSPFSGRSFLTKISQPSFKLNPGQKVPVEVTITIPADFGMDTRYATVYVQSSPVGGSGGVGQVYAVIVPVVLTPAGGLQTRTGVISDLMVKPVEAGKPIEISAGVKNTGNRHFKVKGTATILDPKGLVVAEIPLPMSPNAIIPTFTVQLKAQYNALDRPAGLTTGSYTAKVSITRDDGTQVDNQQTTFEITKPYRPFPEISDQNLFIKCFTDEEPGRINARQKADVEITFENTGKVTGCVAIGKFPQEPAGKPRFTDPFPEGGMGLRAIKYLGIQVQGFDKGTAHVSVAYQSAELIGIGPDNLYLALQNEKNWSKLDNLSVQKGAGIVSGDVFVRRLQSGPVIALGLGDETSGGWEAFLANPMLPIYAALIIVGIVLVLIAILMLNRRRKKQAEQ